MAIGSAEAETVYVTHGFVPELVRYLNETGHNAVPLKTQYVGDDAPEMQDEETETRPVDWDAEDRN